MFIMKRQTPITVELKYGGRKTTNGVVSTVVFWMDGKLCFESLVIGGTNDGDKLEANTILQAEANHKKLSALAWNEYENRKG